MVQSTMAQTAVRIFPSPNFQEGQFYNKKPLSSKFIRTGHKCLYRFRNLPQSFHLFRFGNLGFQRNSCSTPDSSYSMCWTTSLDPGRLRFSDWPSRQLQGLAVPGDTAQCLTPIQKKRRYIWRCPIRRGIWLQRYRKWAGPCASCSIEVDIHRRRSLLHRMVACKSLWLWTSGVQDFPVDRIMCLSA